MGGHRSMSFKGKVSLVSQSVRIVRYVSQKALDKMAG